MKESLAGSKKRPESLFYGDLWYNEAINIEIGRKTCFVLRKKKNRDTFRSPETHWDHYGWQWSLGEKADATACLWS